MQADPLDVPIAVIPRNAREETRISLTEFKATRFLDCRVFSEFAGTTHARSPTKAGLTIALDKLPEFVRAVAAAEAKACDLGLIGGSE